MSVIVIIRRAITNDNGEDSQYAIAPAGMSSSQACDLADGIVKKLKRKSKCKYVSPDDLDDALIEAGFTMPSVIWAREEI